MTNILRMLAVARRLGCHRATVYRKIASGELRPPVRLSGEHGQHGGAVGMPDTEIDDYISKLIAERNVHQARRGAAKPARRKK
jgi:excisionase family DNA binding protein